VHTDLHYEQFLITEAGRVHVIDWGFPGAGAPWVDTAFLVLRLIWAGHPPEVAEQWARARSTWIGVDEKTITAFAVFVAGLWTDFTVTRPPLAGLKERAQLARDHAEWRLRA
jgi:aminoglycoside phosphotransferase (APT) family kinase protein